MRTAFVFTMTEVKEILHHHVYATLDVQRVDKWNIIIKDKTGMILYSQDEIDNEMGTIRTITIEEN